MKRGRPSDYDPKHHPQLAKWMARYGLTEKQIAKELNVAYSTLRKWKKEHSEFLAALKESKDEADSRVEDSLYKRALGYEYTEEKIIGIKTEDSQDKKIVPVRVEKVKKQVPPDVTACIFWLKNRQPQRWRDKREFEHSGGLTYDFKQLSEDDLDRELAAFFAGVAAQREGNVSSSDDGKGTP